MFVFDVDTRRSADSVAKQESHERKEDVGCGSAIGSFVLALQRGIKGVAYAIADDVEAEYRKRDQQDGEDD